MFMQDLISKKSPLAVLNESLRTNGADAPLMKYHVVVRELDPVRSVGRIFYGSVVTHLPLDAWGELNGYQIVVHSPITDRIANKEERTTLF